MTQIFLVRHGETRWNAEEIFRGRADIPLNETGIKQAELLADYLADYEIEAIYSSPLQRALRTAEIVASKRGVEVCIEPRLIDMAFGLWEGKTLKAVRQEYKELFGLWAKSPEKVKIPAGESLDSVRQRAVAVVNEVVARQRGTVVLVSHRVVHKVLILALLGLDNSHFWNVKLDTCGITTFSYEDGRFILTGYNNTSFLKTVERGITRDF